METKALKAKRPGFTDERYMETAYFVENGALLCLAIHATYSMISIISAACNLVSLCIWIDCVSPRYLSTHQSHLKF